MAKKTSLTDARIEKDIVTALKYPPSRPKAAVRAENRWGFIAFCVMLVVFVISPAYRWPMVWLALAACAFLAVRPVFLRLRLRRRIKGVSMKDYDVTTETVQSTSEESYTIRRAPSSFALYPNIHIHNYTLHFESGTCWRIPKDNYLWSEERPMTDLAIFQSTQEGDSFLVVTKKGSGDIVMAYNEAFFEYRFENKDT